MPLTIDTEGLVLAFLGVPAVTAVAAYWLKVYTDNRIKAGFAAAEQARKADYDKELEGVKATLAREGDVLRHEQQRRLQDTGLFTGKRHEVYPALYAICARLARVLHAGADAHGESWWLPPLTKPRALRIAEEAGVDSGHIETLSVGWTVMNEAGRVSELRRLVTNATRETSTRLHHELGEYRAANALYLSNEVEGDTASFVSRAHIYHGLRSTPENLARVDSELRRLKSRMRHELSAGMFDPELPPDQSEAETPSTNGGDSESDPVSACHEEERTPD